MLMPFGKFRGQPVAMLPKRYLRWLTENVDLRGQLNVEVHAALCGWACPSVVDKTPDVDAIVRDIDAQIAELEKEKADVGSSAQSSFTTGGSPA